MRSRALQFAVWTSGASLNAVTCLANDASRTLPVTDVPAATHQVMNSWPWLALGAIVLILAVIALAARRRLPFGRHL